jgi:hypothetical protein
MDDIYVIVVSMSTGMFLAGATIIAIVNCYKRVPREIIEWKNPV